MHTLTVIAGYCLFGALIGFALARLRIRQKGQDRQPSLTAAQRNRLDETRRKAKAAL